MWLTSTMPATRSAGLTENQLRIFLRRTLAFMSTSEETFCLPHEIFSFEFRHLSKQWFITRWVKWRSNTIASEPNFRWEVGIVNHLVMQSIFTFIMIFRCCSYSWCLVPGPECYWENWSRKGKLEIQAFECCTGDHIQWCNSKCYWEAKCQWFYWQVHLMQSSGTNDEGHCTEIAATCSLSCMWEARH